MAISKDNVVGGYNAPAFDAQAVDLSSTDALYTTAFRAIRVGGAGDVKLVTLGGTTTTIPSCLAGELLAVQGTKIFKTGTTATSLVAYF